MCDLACADEGEVDGVDERVGVDGEVACHLYVDRGVGLSVYPSASGVHVLLVRSRTGYGVRGIAVMRNYNLYRTVWCVFEYCAL